MCVNANFYGACGASASTQLGLALAHLDFYLDAFGEVGLEQYWLALSAGTHLFEEMAKIRAMRTDRNIAMRASRAIIPPP